MKKRIIGIMFLLLGILLLPIQSLAHSGIDETQEVSVTIQYELPEVSFKLYQIAEFYKTGEFSLTDAFAEYPIELGDLDSEGWRNAAEAYAGYVVRDQMRPTAEGKTDDDGQLVIGQLENGIYLMVGESVTTEERVKYDIMPSLLSLPTLTELDTWEYDPVVIPKHNVEELPELIQLEVIKLWKNDSVSERPKNIVAQLLKDGVVYEEAVLSAANGWSNRWENLEPEFEWTVVEKDVPSGYTVKVSKTEHAYTITNTGEKTPPEVPVLPQTGQLWWPVPILAMSGFLFLVVGTWCRKRRI